MNIKGSYTIKQGEKILVERNNLITNMGESFFMNRAINSEFAPMQYIVLGDSPFRAKKTDMGLGNETFRKKAIMEVDWNKKQIILHCSCSLSEIVNTTEIGTSNGDILISHDVYEKITSEDLGNNIDSVEITYMFDFSTSSIRRNWLYYTQGDEGNTQNHIYYINEENNVVRVHDNSLENMQTGYHAVANVDALKTRHGAYYYDPFSKNLYVRTLNDEDPNNLSIAITTN